MIYDQYNPEITSNTDITGIISTNLVGPGQSPCLCRMRLYFSSGPMDFSTVTEELIHY